MISDSRTGTSSSFFSFFLNLKRAANFLVTCECTVTLSKAESNQKSTFNFFPLQLCCWVTSRVAFLHPCILKPANRRGEDTQMSTRSLSFRCGEKKKKQKMVKSLPNRGGKLQLQARGSAMKGGKKSLNCQNPFSVGFCCCCVCVKCQLEYWCFFFFSFFFKSSIKSSQLCNVRVLAQESVGQLRL